MSSYGQFCPVAKAMEVLDERWTMLVLRELLAGTRRFNDLRRGVPRMSPALLSKRLQSLQRAGIVVSVDEGSHRAYALTRAGEELRPIVDAIGRWGFRWIGELGDEDLDPHLLLWDMRRSIALDAVPPGRVVVRFRFRDLRADADWWLVIADGEVDVCDFDPGFPVTVRVDADLRAFTRLWRGDIGWAEALRSGGVVLDGPASLRRTLPTWFLPASYAVPRPA